VYIKEIEQLVLPSVAAVLSSSVFVAAGFFCLCMSRSAAPNLLLCGALCKCYSFDIPHNDYRSQICENRSVSKSSFTWASPDRVVHEANVSDLSLSGAGFDSRY